MSEPLTPDLLTEAHQASWDERGARIGARYEVSPCPYSAAELESLRDNGFRVGYLPAELATQRARHHLAEIFPGMHSYALGADNVVTNVDDPYGWFDYEAGLDCPYCDTTEAELMARIAAEGRVLLTLNQYIVASQDSRVRTGHVLDERGYWIRSHSRVDGRIASARFDGSAEAPGGPAYRDPVEGSLLVGYDLGADDHGPTHGARTTAARGRRVLSDPPPPRTALGPTPEHAGLPDGLDLDREWQRLTALYVTFGYHTELGLSAEEYLRSLPRLLPQPAAYRGRFDIPLVIETRIPWARQAALAGVRFVARTSDYAPVDDRSRMPEILYSAWYTVWGRRFPEPVSPADARAGLGDGEIGGNVVELVAMAAAHPEISRGGRFFDAIGYQLPYLEAKEDLTYVQELRTPCTYYWRGAPEIGANIHPRAFSLFRPLARGGKVGTA
ncbi:hypothetical protein [Amycolatopsis sp. GM8]|uniref:hypothetical protein n=1 Tax=Amycolatopsis sp. GM8 TaxID=2896530 RepID=UPI001F4447F2|nr:hypothetical protein [Amycolatopsis sp. GM8]